MGFSKSDKSNSNIKIQAKITSNTIDKLSGQKQTYRYFYDGFPVIFSEHKKITKNGKSKTYGHHVNIDIDINKNEIVSLSAIEHKLGNHFVPMKDSLVILDVSLKNEEYAFVYHLSNTKTGEQYFINAHTAEIELTLPTKYACSAANCSGTSNHYGIVTFNGCYSNNEYLLKNEENNIGLLDAIVFNGPAPQTPSNYVSSNSSFFLDEVATTTYFSMEKTYNYFKNSFQHYGLDGDHFPVKAWLADSDYIFYDKVNKAAIIGADANITIDIVAHEIVHGITYLTAGLIYQSEPGALNESFSDIFGEVVEFYTLGQNDWLVNSDIKNNTAPIRDFANPNNYEQPETYLLNQYWENGFEDCAGVHTNSGVQNHWFYLLCEGGKGVQAIGINKAASIAFKNLNTYLFPMAHYNDAKIGSLQAAEDIFGVNSFEQNQVKKAWQAVGVFNNTELDSLVLVDLYNKANGNNWQVSWNLALPINLWHGVTLNENRRVVELNLSNNNLTGHLTLKIGNLTELTLLDVSNNPNSRTLIFELANLKKLEYLDLSNGNNMLSHFNNCIDDYYLSTLSKLPNLNYLDISNNQLVGCYPHQMRKLKEQIPSISDLQISFGNNFDATWSDFINYNNGYCNNCINNFEISNSNDLKFLPKVYNTIKTNGNIVVNNTSAPTQIYAGDKVILNAGFEVSKNADLVIDIKFCTNN